MGILEHSSNYQNCISGTNKIPEYAREFKNEYLFIKGINKECERFVNLIDEEGKIFDSSKSKKLIYYFNKFLKAQKLGYLNDINEFYLKENDVRLIEFLETEVDNFMDLFYDPYSYEFDQEKYENDNTGLKEFYENFIDFRDKIKIEEITFSDFKNSLKYLSSDSDSDISDSD